MPVSSHPEFQPRVTRILLRSRLHASPVRVPVGADADEIEGLHALAELGREVMLEQHDGGTRYLRASSARMRPANSVTEAAWPVSVTTAR